MVRLVLDGRKTQTRRPIKLGKYRLADPDACEPMNGGLYVPNPTDFVLNVPSGGLSKAMQDKVIYCQYEKGDSLWVRETWRVDGNVTKYYVYKADNPTGKWNPSIHMPKSAARIFLEVTNVRVERLQDITDEDTKAEGVSLQYPIDLSLVHQSTKDQFYTAGYARKTFQLLWDYIYGKKLTWEGNPWVFVIEFKKL